MSLALALLVLSPKTTEIVYVRHAETVANATGRYNSRTLNVFSDLGKKQVENLTSKLKGMRFDMIVVSPSERALRTIAPYLRQTRQTATIWPELYECCHQRGAERKKPASPTVQYGSKITTPTDVSSLFRLRPGGERYIAAPTYNDGMRQIRMSWKLVQDDLMGSGKRILIVGHSIQGSRMLELMQGKTPEGRLRIGNTEVLKFTQTGGKFVRMPG